MPKNYRLQNGTSVSIADTPIGEGGEGAVYEVLSPHSFKASVAKVFNLNRRTKERWRKIEYMVNHPPASLIDNNGHASLIWPQELLFENKKFVGFLMPKAEGIDLEELCRWTISSDLGPTWEKYDRNKQESLLNRLKLCSNIAIAVQTVHATGHYVIGDLKPDNIRVNNNGLVSILDLDSCQIKDGSSIGYESKMNTPRYNPPENISGWKSVTWDLFILSVIFYEILCGIHPFTGTTKFPFENTNTPEQKIKNGLFPYGSQSSLFVVVPSPHQIFTLLTDNLKKLFLRCFDEGIINASYRPTGEEWIKNLTAKPEIIKFETSRDTIIHGIEIKLSWEVENAEEIYINEDIGTVSCVGSILLKPTGEKVYCITAINLFGITEQRLHIWSFPTPVIESLKVPMPILLSEVDLNPININSPNINVSISIDHIFNIDTPFSTIPIQPKFLLPEYQTKKPIIDIKRIYDTVRRKFSQ